MSVVSFFNSKECEWADLKAYVAGAEVTKLRRLQYKALKDKGLLYGSGDKVIGTQSGNRSYEGEMRVLKGALDDLNRAAIAAGGDDILDLEFDVVAVYKEKGSRQLQTVTLVRCQVKEWEHAFDQGAQFMECTLPLTIEDIIPS